MSTFTPITLTASVGSYSAIALYDESDGTGLENENQIYSVVLNSISVQSHADQSTRESLLYNGLDIEAGMYISDDSANTIVRIKSISAKSEAAITCLVEDVDMLSFRLNSNNTMATSTSVVIFRLNSEGEPLIIDTSGFLAGKVDSLQSRFSLNERDDRVKFSHSSAVNVKVGDIVTIDDNGSLVKFGTVGASETKLGVVLELIKGGKDVYIKPFNDIARGYSDPEALTGTPGDIYYTSTTDAGKITTIEGGKAAFLHLNNAVATSLEITSAILPTNIDTLEINSITVFDGPGGNTVVDSSALSVLINTFTSQTNVTSAVAQAPASVDSDDNSPNYAGYWPTADVFIPIGTAGGSPGSYAEVTISDGVNSGNVVFDTPDVVANIGGTNYDIMSPTAIAAEFNATIVANGLDIICVEYDKASGVGNGVKLTTTGSATGITLTNVAADAFGANIVGGGSATGIGLTATLGDALLTLTRASGGAILIDGSPNSGGYINQGGVVSSNSGRIPHLLLIESEGAADQGVQVSGVDTRADLNQNPNVTSVDGDSTGITITHTPFLDGNVTVKVNGMEVDLGDKTFDCYFSNDAGVSARPVADIEAGDTLYWNGSIAGYELDATDDVDIRYMAGSDDIENYVAPAPPSPIGPASPAPGPGAA